MPVRIPGERTRQRSGIHLDVINAISDLDPAGGLESGVLGNGSSPVAQRLRIRRARWKVLGRVTRLERMTRRRGQFRMRDPEILLPLPIHASAHRDKNSLRRSRFRSQRNPPHGPTLTTGR